VAVPRAVARRARHQAQRDLRLCGPESGERGETVRAHIAGVARAPIEVLYARSSAGCYFGHIIGVGGQTSPCLHRLPRAIGLHLPCDRDEGAGC